MVVEGLVFEVSSSLDGYRNRRDARKELERGLTYTELLLKQDAKGLPLGADRAGFADNGSNIEEYVLPFLPQGSHNGDYTVRIFPYGQLKEFRKRAYGALETYIRRSCDRKVWEVRTDKIGSYENLPDEETLERYIGLCAKHGILPQEFEEEYKSRLEAAEKQKRRLIEADRQEKELSERRRIEDRFIDLSERITYLSRMKPYVGHPSTDKPPEIGVLGRLFAGVSIGDAFGLKGLLAEKIYPSKIGLAYGVFGEALEEAAKYLSEHPEHTDVLGLVAARTFRDVLEATQPLAKYAEAYDSDCMVKDAFGQYTEMLGLFGLPLSREADILRELYNLAEADLTARMEKLTDEVERLADEHAEVSRRRSDLRLSRGDTLRITR